MNNKYIHYSGKFLKALTENIKLDDLLTEKEQNKKKFKLKMGSIFNYFDKNQKNGELDINEINKLLENIDINKNKVITNVEIIDFCETKNLDYKVLKEFVERINNKILNIGETEKFENVKNRENGFNHSYYFYYLEKTPYGNDFVQYNTTFDNNDKASAIYDIKNDTLLDENLGNKIKITGIKSFQDKTFKNGKFVKPNKDLETYPKIIIETENGPKEIELRINYINISSKHWTEKKPMNDEEKYMYIMTNVLDKISELPEKSLNNLIKNVKFIEINNIPRDIVTEEKSSGRVNHFYKFSDNYYESIKLNANDSGLFSLDIWVHEIGHTIDANITGYSTEKDKETLQNFINLIKENPKFKYSNTLKDIYELFADFTIYKELGEKDNSLDKYKLFSYLDNLPDSNDKQIKQIKAEWAIVKPILENIENTSNASKLQYEADKKDLEDKYKTVNSKESAIKLEDIEKYNPDDLRNCFEDEIRQEFENAIKSNGISYYEYKIADNPLDIVKKLRNFDNVKPIVQKLLTKTEQYVQAKKTEEEKLNNMTIKESLKYTEEKINSGQSVLINSNNLIAVINKKSPDELENFLNSKELRDIITKICKYDDSLHPKIREKYKEGSTEPITKEVLLAFRNDNGVKYLLLEKGYIHKKK